VLAVALLVANATAVPPSLVSSVEQAASAHDGASLARLLTRQAIAGLADEERGDLLSALIDGGEAEALTQAIKAGIRPDQLIALEVGGKIVKCTALNYALTVPGSDEVPLRLLALGADPNATADVDLPSLLNAISAQRYGLVAPLLAHGADPNQHEPKFGVSVLMLALNDRQDPVRGLEAARQLAAAGADLNHRVLTGHTPLMLAVMAGNAAAVRWLLDAGADWRITSADGDTALSMALRNDPGRTSEIVQRLVSARAGTELQNK
jgi:hypothetical protein